MVQLDVDNPYADRLKEDGRHRLMLSKEEKEILKEKELAAKALALFIEKRASIPQVAKELGLDEDKLIMIAKSPQYPIWQEALAKRCAELFLSIDDNFSRGAVAKTLGMSENQLRRFTRSEVFQNAYNELFVNVTEDPMPKTVQLMIQEQLLPEAMKVLRKELTDDEVPWSVKQKARQDVFKLSGIEQVERKENDRAEAAKFLAEVGVVNTGDSYNIIIPPEFTKAMEKFGISEVIDAEHSQIEPDHTEDNQD
jgi:hypothetical protein